MLDSSFTEFKLDYPEIKKNRGIGSPLSKIISAGHYSWKIECCYWEDDEDHVLDLYLCLCYSKFNRFNGFCEAFLVRSDGAPSSCRLKRSVLEMGEYNLCNWSGHLCVRRNCLESRYVKDGVITLICGVIALPGNFIAVPATNMSDHFRSLLECPDGSDVSFVAGGETFRAHRAVLAARSSVFKAELFGSLAEANMRCITLHGIEPGTFKAILWFMYTDRLSVDLDPESFSLTPQQFQRVLAAADMYDLRRLKLMCAQELWDMVSVETVATTLCYAEMHNCPELKDKCLDFFMTGKNFKRIVVTEGYLWLMQRFPSVIDEIKARLETLNYV